MAAILLVGTGAVGACTARQLVDTPGIDRLLVAGRRASHGERIAAALGDRAAAAVFTPGDAIPDAVDAVASALPAEPDGLVAAAAVEAGVPFASSVDDSDGIAQLLDLDERAGTTGVFVAAGCGLAPGFSDLLARHAADALDRVDEIHVARSGAAGHASLASLRRARREPSLEWRDGDWLEDRHHHPELVWFPDPIGARECDAVASGVPLLVRAFPGVQRVTLRLGEPPARRLSWSVRRDLTEEWGSARVEVWGWRGQARESMVYGVIDRTAVAAGTVLAVAAARLAGLLPGLHLRPGQGPGVHGLASLFESVPFLGELARRGVKAAVFEGVAVA